MSSYIKWVKIKNNLDAISHTACTIAIDVQAKAIVVCSVSGITASMVSRFRRPVDIIGMTTDERVWRQLALSWGVTPVLIGGPMNGHVGNTNTIKVAMLQ